MFHTSSCLQGTRRKPTLAPPTGRRIFSSLALSISLLATLFTAPPTLAQSPSPVQEMAFMRGGNYLYVQGGKFVTNEVQISVSSQLAALDLSKSWSTNAPVWKLLNPGPARNLYNGVLTADNQTLITFFNDQELFVSIYSVPTNSWQYTSVKTSGELLQAIRTIIDPKTGLVYIDGANNMNVFNPTDRSYTYNPIPPGILNARFFAGAGYHPTRRSIMYMGGVTGALQFEPETYITEFSLDAQSWGTFPTIGKLPTPRCDHCMAISEDGNTVVMFGGRTPPPGNFTGTFYILDVPSKTWVQGPSASTRLYSACIIVGDQFVVWGGFDGKSTIDGPPIIYSFTQKKWVEQYTPPPYFADMPTAPSVPGGGGGSQNPNTPTNPDGSSNGNTGGSTSSNLGGILGGTLGSLCVVALAGVVYLYMKRRGDRAMYEAQAQQRIIRQAERTNESSRGGNNNTGGGAGGGGSVVGSGEFTKSTELSTLPPYIMTTARNPQIAAAMAADNNSNTSLRSPQDALAMGLHFEPHNRHDPQLLPISPLNTPMGPSDHQQQQFKPSVFVPSSGTLTPTIFDPSTINCTQGGGPVVGYTTIPVQTTAGLAYMSVPVQSSPPCPGTVGTGPMGAYGYTSVPVQVPMPVQNYNNGAGGLVYTPVPLQSPAGGGYLQPGSGVAGGTPTMGYAGFTPMQSSDHDSSPGSVHRPLVVSGSSAGYSSPSTLVTSAGGDGEYYYPPPPHPAASGP